MARIQAEAFKRRILGSLPNHPSASTVDPAVQTEPEPADLATLPLIADDEEFLREAYRRILGREADIVGFLHHRENLQGGLPREVIIERLANSEEARRLGRKFAGLPGFKSFPAKLRRWASVGGRSWKQSIVGRIRTLARSVLQISRMERIERTVDALVHELLVRSDQISVKTDHSLWTLSSKLDTYVADIVHRQDRIAELSRSHAGQVEASLARLSAELSRSHTAQIEALLYRLSKVESSLLKEIEKVRESLLTESGRSGNELALLRDEFLNLNGTISETLSTITDTLSGLPPALFDQLSMFSKRLSDQNARRDQAVEVLSQWQRQLDQTLTEQREQLRRSTELLSEKTATGSTVILNELQSGRIESAIRASIKPPVVGGGDNVVACEVDGLILGVPGEEWRMAAYYAFRGTMEPGPTRLFKEMVKPGMVVVDIGANIGIYTLEAARLMAPTGRVYSFEPAPRVFGILKDNIQVNG